MSNVKREACRAIAASISANVAALTGKCEAGQADEEVTAEYPALRVIPRRFVFEPFQDEEIGADNDADAAYLIQRGDFEGQVEVRIYALDQYERGELEEAVMQWLLGEDDAPGARVLTTANLTLGGVATLYAAPLTVDLDEEDWREEMAFDKKRMSFLTLQVAYPALVARSAPLINTLYLAIAHDLSDAAPAEEKRIDENGDLFPA